MNEPVTGEYWSCREHETKFLVRTLVSNLRVGANWRSVIGAMARAVVMHREGPRVPKARLDAAATAASEAYHVGMPEPLLGFVVAMISIPVSCVPSVPPAHGYWLLVQPARHAVSAWAASESNLGWTDLAASS